MVQAYFHFWLYKILTIWTGLPHQVFYGCHINYLTFTMLTHPLIQRNTTFPKRNINIPSFSLTVLLTGWHCVFVMQCCRWGRLRIILIVTFKAVWYLTVLAKSMDIFLISLLPLLGLYSYSWVKNRVEKINEMNFIDVYIRLYIIAKGEVRTKWSFLPHNQEM